MKFLRGQEDSSVEVSLTPLVDIIFLLIIFFLVSSTFEKGEKNLGIILPTTKGQSSNSVEPMTWTIVINADGDLRLNEKAITLQRLESQLRRQQGQRDQILIRIKADRRTPHGNVASVWGLLNEFDFKKAAITTLGEQP